MNNEEIARVCHEANRGYQQVLAARDQDGGIPVAPPWDLATAEMRESAINGVAASLTGKTDEEMHQNWRDFKAAGGWTYGEVRSDELKQHPCLVPYAELPAEQRVKDALFSGIVAALADKPTWQPPPIDHIVSFERRDGERIFGLQHPRQCTPDLLDCPVNIALMDSDVQDTHALGKYFVTTTKDGGLSFGAEL